MNSHSNNPNASETRVNNPRSKSYLSVIPSGVLMLLFFIKNMVMSTFGLLAYIELVLGIVIFVWCWFERKKSISPK